MQSKKYNADDRVLSSTQEPNLTDTASTFTQRVLDAVRELHALEQVATRESVAELTGIKQSSVDSCLRDLTDDGKLRRLIRGIYEMVEMYPRSRAVSKTVLDDGCVLIEVGDDMLRLTPAEDRALALVQAGAAAQAAAIESSRQHLFLATSLAAKVEAMSRELRTLKAKHEERQQKLL